MVREGHWETISACLLSRGLIAFVAEVCVETALEDSVFLQSRKRVYLPSGKIKVMSLFRAKLEQVCPQPIIKPRGFLNSGLLSCEANPLCVQHPHGPLHTAPMELWGTQRTHVNIKLMLPAESRVTKSFVSYLIVTCLLPVSMKKRQAHLLACKQGKTVPSQFLMGRKKMRYMGLEQNETSYYLFFHIIMF